MEEGCCEPERETWVDVEAVDNGVTVNVDVELEVALACDCEGEEVGTRADVM